MDGQVFYLRPVGGGGILVLSLDGLKNFATNWRAINKCCLGSIGVQWTITTQKPE